MTCETARRPAAAGADILAKIELQAHITIMKKNRVAAVICTVAIAPYAYAETVAAAKGEPNDIPASPTAWLMMATGDTGAIVDTNTDQIIPRPRFETVRPFYRPVGPSEVSDTD